MTILAFGINHKAPVDLRGKVYFSNDILPHALTEFINHRQISEAAILSTCNRTEVYCSLQQAEIDASITWLAKYHGLSPEELAPFIYAYTDAKAVKHILRVASGLDSMVLGEPQILGQMKSSYKNCLKAGGVGKLLDKLFQYSFRIAKQIRTTTELGTHPVSIAFATVRLAQKILGDLSNHKTLLIGAGSTIRLIARYLYENSLTDMIIANRNIKHSQFFVDQYVAQQISLSDIPQYLAKVDIIISSTASPLPIIGKGTFESALKIRKHKPIFVVDIAVPRDIEAEAGELDDVYLYTVDDLKNVTQDNLYNRRKAALQADKIIGTQVSHFMGWLNSLDATSTIRSLRSHADSIQKEALILGEKELRKGVEPNQVLQNITRLLTNKLMHSPSNQLRIASAKGRTDLLAATAELFALGPDKLIQASDKNKKNINQYDMLSEALSAHITTDKGTKITLYEALKLGLYTDKILQGKPEQKAISKDGKPARESIHQLIAKYGIIIDDERNVLIARDHKPFKKLLKKTRCSDINIDDYLLRLPGVKQPESKPASFQQADIQNAMKGYTLLPRDILQVIGL